MPNFLANFLKIRKAEADEFLTDRFLSSGPQLTVASVALGGPHHVVCFVGGGYIFCSHIVLIVFLKKSDIIRPESVTLGGLSLYFCGRVAVISTPGRVFPNNNHYTHLVCNR